MRTYCYCNITIWADDTALNSSCDKPSDLSQQFEIAYELYFDILNQIVGKYFCFFILKSQDLN